MPTPIADVFATNVFNESKMKAYLANDTFREMEKTIRVGPEQEYFLVDCDFYRQRKDLLYTGRTLFGTLYPKGQELEDHCFGTIKSKVQAFIVEWNQECWKLGIQAKTEHNEVALLNLSWCRSNALPNGTNRSLAS